MYTKLTTKDFIERAIKVHGDKYDYSKVEYTNNKTKVCIICPIHGEFWQTPKKHLKGQGCKKCGFKIRTPHGPLYSKRLTTKEFINKAIEVHGGKYDYSKVEYVTMKEKVTIVCPYHGIFLQLPSSHLKGHGCPICAKNKELTTEEFIKRAKLIHGNKYDYSKVEYKDIKTKVCIICPKHGEFWQRPSSHLDGQGCPICKGENIRAKKIKGKERFIDESICVHGNKYDYSKVEYVNSSTKVCIICPIHGEFWQTPMKHLNGHGCQRCNSSKLEEEMRIFLNKNNIDFEEQKSFEWLKSKQNFLRLDFYLPKYKTAIECQGIQHFQPTDFGGKGDEYANKVFNLTKSWDKLKSKKCKENQVKLLYYSSEEIKNKFNQENLITDKNILLENIN